MRWHPKGYRDILNQNDGKIKDRVMTWVMAAALLTWEVLMNVLLQFNDRASNGQEFLQIFLSMYWTLHGLFISCVVSSYFAESNHTTDRESPRCLATAYVCLGALQLSCYSVEIEVPRGVCASGTSTSSYLYTSNLLSEVEWTIFSTSLIFSSKLLIFGCVPDSLFVKTELFFLK